MFLVHRRFWQAVWAAVLLTALPGAARGVGWQDDFNDGSITDGNPVTWITDLGGSGFFPGVYSAASGDFFMDPADASPTGSMSALVPISFADTYIRTQGVVLPDPNDPLNDGGNLVVTARLNPNDVSGYLLYFDVGGQLAIQSILPGGVIAPLSVAYQAPFNAASDAIIELNIIGDQLDGYVWQASDPNGKPSVPQVSVIDSTYAAGFTGLSFDEDDPGTSVLYRYVQVQDAPFIDLNPSNGDFDGDNDVDGADFVTWQRGLGLTGQTDPSTGDADDDGDVDAQDLALWTSHFGGASTAAATQAIPEPATLGLLAGAALAAGALRARAASAA